MNSKSAPSVEARFRCGLDLVKSGSAPLKLNIEKEGTMWPMIVSLLNDLQVMRVLAAMFFLLAVAFALLARWALLSGTELEEEREILEAKLSAMKRKTRETLAQKQFAKSMWDEAEVWGKQWRARAIGLEKQVDWLQKKLVQCNAAPSRQEEKVASAQGPPTSTPAYFTDNFKTSSVPKEGKVKFPKNLDEMEESLNKGGKLMSKMRKQKSLIREVGFLRAVMMFGLTYVLASMIKESWDRIKHRFEDEDKDNAPGETEE